MIIEIDMHSSIPIYKQLKTSIISGILSGQLSEGDSLPSIRQLASDLSINLHTVRKVYNMLLDEGYVKMHRSQGAIVCKPPKLDKENLDTFFKLLLPIVIELRAKGIDYQEFTSLMEKLWQISVEGDEEHD